MAIEIKEYVGHEFLTVNQKSTEIKNLSESNVQTYVDENSLMVDIEAIHSRITRNNTYYSPECLKQSVPYWTNPYERPVIMHHNERDGQIIGRVKAVEYKETGTRSGTPALIFTANVGDEEGKKGIKNGTLSTVSIGVIAHDLRCSICGTNLAEEGMCEHEKGEVYDDKLCYWIINKMEPKEVSYVIVPSDIYAHNIRVYDAVKKTKSEVKEKVEYNPFTELAESIKSALPEELTEGAETQEGTQVDEEVKDGEKTTEPVEPETEATEDESKEEDKKPEEGEESEKKEDESEEATKEDESKKTEEGEEQTEESEEDKSKAELEAKEAKIKELEDKVADLEKAKAELEKENEKLANKVDSEKKLRESAETELITYRTEKKKVLVESVNSLRKQLNLPLEDAAVLMEASEENLKLSVKQLTEFTEVQKRAFGLNPIESPVAVSESRDNTSKENKKVDVKESTSTSNKSLEEQILDTMSKLW